MPFFNFGVDWPGYLVLRKYNQSPEMMRGEQSVRAETSIPHSCPQVLGDFPDAQSASEEDATTSRGGPAMINNMRSHLAARELVVRVDSSSTDRAAAAAALELFYKTWIASNEHGELPYLASFGLLTRVEFPALLIEELRLSDRWHYPAAQPGPIMPAAQVLPGDHLLSKRDLPRRRRVSQWRVVHEGTVVSRVRPSHKAAPASFLEPGAIVWASRSVVGADGLEFLVLADEFEAYLLVDATSLGFGLLVERVEGPECSADVCGDCWHDVSSCMCELLESYGE